MSFDDRLSYLQSNDTSHRLEYSSLINPCKNLFADFEATAEEAQTDVKVYLRIRPLLREESIIHQEGNIVVKDKKTIVLTAPVGSHAFKSKPKGTNKVSHNFKFSHVYDRETNQKLLFEETSFTLVNDLVKGENGLLFTYGATNSGKTYTIQGTQTDIGLLPRSLESLFHLIGSRTYPRDDLKPWHFSGVVRMSEKQAQDEEDFRVSLLQLGSLSHTVLSQSTCSVESTTSKYTEARVSPESTLDEGSENLQTDGISASGSENTSVYAVFASFAEIYNEYIYDLLDNSLFQKLGGKKSPLSLGEDVNGSIYIKGLKEVRVKTAEEALKILDIGKRNLHFAATKLNHKSSRSHSIFTIKLIHLADPLYPHVAKVSMLSLCDLAGAERNDKTLNSMDRLKEASNINTSLLVLGRCMTALRHNQTMSRQICGAKKTIVVPYRESKVTRLFQSFFMGEGKVTMIVNISLSSVLFDETLNVLKFSALAREVSITRDRSHTPEEIVDQTKPPSRFSRMVRQSLNMSQASSRLSVPWISGNYPDLTFGQSRPSQMGAVVEEEEDDSEDDERYKYMQEVITKLKDKLLQECRERAADEKRIRHELCDAFSKRMVHIEETWENRLNEERSRKEELMEWRLKNVIKGMKESRKRPREDSFDDDQETVPSVLLVREENKVRESEQEKTILREELDTLKASLTASTKATKAAKEEISKLIFQLAQKEQTMNEMKQQMEELEKLPERKSVNLDELIVDELQRKNERLETKIKTRDIEIKDLKDMLLEASEEFQKNRNQIDKIKEEKTNTTLLLNDLESQLAESKYLLSNRNQYLDEREKELEELRSQIQMLKESEKLKEVEADNTKVTALQHEVSTMKQKLSTNDEQIEKQKKHIEELGLDKMDLEMEVENLNSDLKLRQSTLDTLQNENEELKQEVTELKKSQLSKEQDSQVKFSFDASQLENHSYRLEELKSDLDEVIVEKEKLIVTVKTLTSEMEDLKSERENLLTEQEELLEKLIKRGDNDDDKLAEVNQLKESLKMKEKDYEILLNELREGEDKMNDLATELDGLKIESKTKEKQEMILLTEVNLLRSENDNLQQNIKHQNEANENISTLKSSYEETISSITDQSKENERRIVDLESKLKEVQMEKNNLSEQLTLLKECLKAKSDHVETISEQMSSKEKQFEMKLHEIEDFKQEICNLRQQLQMLEKSKEIAKDELETNIKDGQKNIESLKEQIQLLLSVEEERNKLLSVVKEKEELILALSTKTDSLDRKRNQIEAEHEQLKSKCQVMQKELVATKEARAEENRQLNAQLEVRDYDIEKLQQELKRNLQVSISATQHDDSNEESKNKIESLQEELRRTETERYSLAQRVSGLQNQLESSQLLQHSLPSRTSSRKKCERAKKVYSPAVDDCSSDLGNRADSSSRINSETSDSSLTRVTRSTRATKKKVAYVEQELPTLTLDASDLDDFQTPSCSKKNKKGSVSVGFKVPTSSGGRRRRVLKGEERPTLEDDKDSSYEPTASTTKKSTAKKSSSRGKGRSRKQTNELKVFNPHLENNENIDTSNLTENVSSDKSGTDTVPTKRNPSRRRALYSMNSNEEFNQIPQNADPAPPPNMDSPHSVVLRKLRNK